MAGQSKKATSRKRAPQTAAAEIMSPRQKLELAAIEATDAFESFINNIENETDMAVFDALQDALFTDLSVQGDISTSDAVDRLDEFADNATLVLIGLWMSGPRV